MNYEFNIDFRDDKKEKWQSCEYFINIKDTLETITNNASTNLDINIGGYGYTKDEAKNECIKELDKFIENFNKELLEFRKTLDEKEE